LLLSSGASKGDYFVRIGAIAEKVREVVFGPVTQRTFRFKENALSWRSSKNVLFIAYEDLCESKDKELLRMSSFLGITLPNFEVRKRQAKEDNTPAKLINLAMREYKDIFLLPWRKVGWS